MSLLQPIFAYMVTLAVIQPARIQDIEENAPLLLGRAGDVLAKSGDLRKIHESARREGLVISVRKGLYVLSRGATERLRSHPIAKNVDNRRLFLIKQARKRIV